LGTYRDKLDIIADILHVASSDAKKTQIMYQANLSYKVLQRYLKEIIEASLIRFETSNQSYMLTSKGAEYLQAYKQYSRTNKSIEKRLNDFSNKKKILEELCLTKNCLSKKINKVSNVKKAVIVQG
jgi:predicted transcriptional regulator